jgi:hypothetical protein
MAQGLPTVPPPGAEVAPDEVVERQRELMALLDPDFGDESDEINGQ